jgi:hypothetical protein
VWLRRTLAVTNASSANESPRPQSLRSFLLAAELDIVRRGSLNIIATWLRRALTLCPSLTWFTTLVVTIFAGEAIFPGHPVLVVWLGVGVALFAAELSRVLGGSCTWLPEALPTRVLFYVCTFPFGALVIRPGVTLDREVLLVFRLPAAVLLVSASALFVLHIRQELSPRELTESLVLRAIAALPVFILVGFGLLVIIAGVLALVRST